MKPLFCTVLLLLISSLQSQERSFLQLEKNEKQIHSQNGEDGIIHCIFRHVGTSSKYYVEFGAADGSYLSNTRYLRECEGWKGLLLDSGYENPSINLHREFISAENINQIFEKYGVPENLDLLSIDIDGNDFYVWQALDPKYKPRLVVIEYNASHLPNEDKVIEYDPLREWDETNYFGASILAFYRLGQKKGYSLIYAESQGINLFFLRNDLIEQFGFTFQEVNDIEQLYRPPCYGTGPNGGHSQDPFHRPYVSAETLLKNRSESQE